MGIGRGGQRGRGTEAEKRRRRGGGEEDDEDEEEGKEEEEGSRWRGRREV